MEIYTVIEVAKLFKVTEQTIKNWIKSGKLKAFKIGHTVRITRAELERVQRGE